MNVHGKIENKGYTLLLTILHFASRMWKLFMCEQAFSHAGSFAVLVELWDPFSFLMRGRIYMGVESGTVFLFMTLSPSLIFGGIPNDT